MVIVYFVIVRNFELREGSFPALIITYLLFTLVGVTHKYKEFSGLIVTLTFVCHTFQYQPQHQPVLIFSMTSCSCPDPVHEEIHGVGRYDNFLNTFGSILEAFRQYFGL